jgi:hypothetical protein
MPVNAAALNSERPSRDFATALLPFRPKLRARRGRSSKFAGPQIVGVAINEAEPALQSFAVRQEPLASPLLHTRQTRVHRMPYLRARHDSVP